MRKPHIKRAFLSSVFASRVSRIVNRIEESVTTFHF
jgi:hypothetical protein